MKYQGRGEGEEERGGEGRREGRRGGEERGREGREGEERGGEGREELGREGEGGKEDTLQYAPCHIPWGGTHVYTVFSGFYFSTFTIQYIAHRCSLVQAQCDTARGRRVLAPVSS